MRAWHCLTRPKISRVSGVSGAGCESASRSAAVKAKSTAKSASRNACFARSCSSLVPARSASCSIVCRGLRSTRSAFGDWFAFPADAGLVRSLVKTHPTTAAASSNIKAMRMIRWLVFVFTAQSRILICSPCLKKEKLKDERKVNHWEARKRRACRTGVPVIGEEVADATTPDACRRAGAQIETESEGCVPYVAKDLVILRRSAGVQNGLMFFVEVIQDLGIEDFTRADQRS